MRAKNLSRQNGTNAEAINSGCPRKELVMSKKFAGKIAVIAGGSTCMGFATAKCFAPVNFSA